jgi:diaminopimelate epimerase
MQHIQFVKLEGAGNDFVFLDDRDGSFDGRKRELAQKLSPRHTAIGADGVIFIRIPPPETGCVVEMVYHNADGSYAGMCGNGIRCTALYALEKMGVAETKMHVLVDGEPRELDILKHTPGFLTAKADMGMPVLDTELIPANVEGPQHIGKPLALAEGFAPECTLVSMGNPHCTMWLNSFDDALVNRIGPLVERHPFFPQRVNAGFARMEGGDIVLRVWERGVGETAACGSGACAAMVSAVLTGRAPAGKDVNVRLPGGTLILNWGGDDHSVFMTGPARIAFEGTVDV